MSGNNGNHSTSGVFVFMGFSAVVSVCIIVACVAVSNAQREMRKQRRVLAEELAEASREVELEFSEDEDAVQLSENGKQPLASSKGVLKTVRFS